MRRFLPSGLFIVTMAVLIFLYAPIGVVVANSFNDDANLTSWGGFTLRWYETAVENQRVRDAAVTSLKIAAITTVFSLVIAVTAGLWSRTASQRKRRGARRQHVHADRSPRSRRRPRALHPVQAPRARPRPPGRSSSGTSFSTPHTQRLSSRRGSVRCRLSTRRRQQTSVPGRIASFGA